MSFVRFIEGHSRTILVVAFALSLGGAIAAFSLAVGLFPQVTFPRIRITVDSGDRPADQMALMVTRKVEEAVRQGATAFIQPGGSVRDQEVIEAADRHSMAMIFTGVRHFRH